jgi:hypothetical protein
MNLILVLILCQLFSVIISKGKTNFQTSCLNSVFLTIIFEYHLSDAPKLLALSQQNTVSEGVLFRSYCSIQSGTKPLFFQWSKNGQILSNSPQTRYKIENFEDHSFLKILSVIRTDSGNYSCIARNAFGTDSQSTMLLVKGLNNF